MTWELHCGDEKLLAHIYPIVGCAAVCRITSPIGEVIWKLDIHRNTEKNDDVNERALLDSPVYGIESWKRFVKSVDTNREATKPGSTSIEQEKKDLCNPD
jgi:hypothetical protein